MRHRPDHEIEGGGRATAPPLSAADCPIEALREEHFRQRQFCKDMEVLADTAVPRPALALALLVTLCRDRPLHHLDEDEGLFPRLRARALPEDEIAALIDRLSAEHAGDTLADPGLLAALACMADGALPAPEDRTALRALAQSKRRHILLENAVILPIAAMRLTASDRAALLAEMRARRAEPPPTQGYCARLLARVDATSSNPDPKPYPEPEPEPAPRSAPERTTP